MTNEHEIATAELLKSVKIEDPESKAIAAARAKTMKHLSAPRRHHANQNKLIKTGPAQVRQRLAQRVNDFMDTVVLPNGGAGVVRKKRKKFKRRNHVKKVQSSEEEEDEESAKSRRKSVRKLPKGAMLKRYRDQKRMFARKELRKFYNSRYFGLRLSLANEKMQRETVHRLKPTVWVRPDPRTGRPGYVRMDERRKRSFDSVRQQYRALVPLDKRVNKQCGPLPDKEDYEYPLVGIDMSDEESTNEDGITGKELDYEDFYPETSTPNEVCHMPFMVKSTAVGNLSGEEDFFYENGTWKQAKMEEVNPSDLSDYEADNPENQDNQENQGTPDREEPNNDHELSENQNENEQNMDLDEPHPNTGNCQAQEVAQNTGVSSEFLTRCESGRIVEATWNGKPPTTKEYEEDQRQMRTLRNVQDNLQAQDQVPMPSTSSGYRGRAATAEMSNQDIKARSGI